MPLLRGLRNNSCHLNQYTKPFLFTSHARHKAPRLLDFRLNVKSEANAAAGAGSVEVAAAIAAHRAKGRGVGRTRGC